MQPIDGLSSCGAPYNQRPESPLSETYTCSDSGGALSMDDHWEPGTASRFAGLQSFSASLPHAKAYPSRAPLEQRAGDASCAVNEKQAADADLVKAVAVEQAVVAAATAVDNGIATTAVVEDTAAVAAVDEVAPALLQSSVISLCAVGDETHLRAQLSRTRAQLHVPQPVEILASAAPQRPYLEAERCEEAAGPRSCICVTGCRDVGGAAEV